MPHKMTTREFCEKLIELAKKARKDDHTWYYFEKAIKDPEAISVLCTRLMNLEDTLEKVRIYTRGPHGHNSNAPMVIGVMLNDVLKEEDENGQA